MAESLRLRLDKVLFVFTKRSHVIVTFSLMTKYYKVSIYLLRPFVDLYLFQYQPDNVYKTGLFMASL